VDQVIDEIVVVNAIHADFDRPEPARILAAQMDDFADLIVGVALRVVRILVLTLGELGRQVQRLEIVVVPVNVPLQFAGIQLERPIRVGGCILPSDLPELARAVVDLVPVHENVLTAGHDRPLTEVNDERELHATDRPQPGGIRQHEEIPHAAPVTDPLHVESVGIHDVGLADFLPVDAKDHLQVGRDPVRDIELNLAPPNAKGVPEIIAALEIPAQFSAYRPSQMGQTPHSGCKVFQHIVATLTVERGNHYE
jgi:hypothetical protein